MSTMKFLLATILAAASVNAFVPTSPQHAQISAKTFVKKNTSFSRLFAEGEDGVSKLLIQDAKSLSY